MSNPTDTKPSTERRTIDLGNNETASTGVIPQEDGTFLALTFTRSKTFATRKGADRWYLRATGKVSL